MLDISAISKSDARHVLFYKGAEHGFQPGSFTQKALELISIADEENFNLLASIYPGLASAYHIASNEQDGIYILQEISIDTIADNFLAAARGIEKGESA